MTTRRFVPATLLLLAVCSLAFAGAEADKSIEKARQAIQKKQFKKAIKEYEIGLQAEPQNAKIKLLAGITYAAVGEFEKALQLTQESIAIEASFTGYQYLGLIQANRGDFESSITAYEKALSMNPTAFRSWYQLGNVLSVHGDFDKAIDAFRKAVELNPRFFESYLGMARAQYLSGDKPSAMQQVLRLKQLGAVNEASALESWLQNKDRKKMQLEAASRESAS